MKNNRFTEEIIDPERYNALKLQQNFDMKTEKYSHIPEIETLPGYKKFFSGDSRPRNPKQECRSLRTVLEQITNEHGEIAFDIVGSLNMGLSSISSDIDLIIYLRIENEYTGECFRG